MPQAFQIITSRQLADKLGIYLQRITRYCADGLVPFARKLNNEWIIDQRGARFIEGWLKQRPQLGAWWKVHVAKAAAKLDARCAQRQAEAGMEEYLAGRITPDDVAYIHEQRRAGRELGDIAASQRISKYELTVSALSYICSGRSYGTTRQRNAYAKRTAAKREFMQQQKTSSAKKPSVKKQSAKRRDAFRQKMRDKKASRQSRSRQK